MMMLMIFFYFLRFYLREIMIDLGIPVGHPKLVFKDGLIENLNRVNCDEETWLLECEKNALELQPVMGYIRNELDKTEETGQHYVNDMAKINLWLPYTVGATIDHPKLVSPERLSLSTLHVKRQQKVSKFDLANLFHQLCPFLPINSLDEVNDRLKNLLAKVFSCNNGWLPGVAEVY